jgi:hypothetical protein
MRYNTIDNEIDAINPTLREPNLINDLYLNNVYNPSIVVDIGIRNQKYLGNILNVIIHNMYGSRK